MPGPIRGAKRSTSFVAEVMRPQGRLDTSVGPSRGILRLAPVIRLHLVIQVPNARNQRRVPVLLRPIDCPFLRMENSKGVVGMILDHVIFDSTAFRPALRARLHVNICHDFLAEWLVRTRNAGWPCSTASRDGELS